MEPEVNDRQELAQQVDWLIREIGIKSLRDAVRQVAADRVNALDEAERREEARREALVKTGVEYGHQELPERPKEGDWFTWLTTFRGSVKGDPNEFDELRAAGFPSEQGGEAYEVDVEGWIPGELSPDQDPHTYDLLPIPRRGLTVPEKLTILSAIHDAHGRGNELVAPWGVSREGNMPTTMSAEAESNEGNTSHWYYMLTRTARELTSDDAILARDFIKAIQPEQSNPVGEDSNVASKPNKLKRSTVRGEGRDKLISALTKHHKYADGSCLNLEPVGNNKLAQLVKVSPSTASAFFKQEFGGHVKYRAMCTDESRLITALKLLNQEFSPDLLYGAVPPGERDRDDEK